ncbi:MAG: hypothetical protein KKB70_06260 [Proteobacteria bacterium]|nr:hypothetical protein [Pseudomonadota bacterium]
MSNPTNKDRAEIGRAVMNFFGSLPGQESDTTSGLVDVLTNLMHLAEDEGIYFQSCVETAKMHFDQEHGGE